MHYFSTLVNHNSERNSTTAKFATLELMHRRFGFTLILRKAFHLERKKAFTLIELMVVIAILGILVSLSSLVWGSVAARGRDNTRKTDLARLKNTLEQYATDNRAYPTYDTSQGRIYAANWQLDGTNGCAHDDDINARLVNKPPLTNYISNLPTDPKRKLDLGPGCGDNYQDQHSLYLYLSAPAGTNGQGPSSTSSANAYALLATLEQAAGQTQPSDNPIKSPIGKFSYYCAGTQITGCQLDNYNFDANYVIFGGSTR